MNNNNNSYKVLKERQLSGRKRVYEFDQSLSNVIGKLVPRSQVADQSSAKDNTKELQNMQDDYNKKINSTREAVEKQLAEGEGNRSSIMENLGKQIQAGDDRNLEISQSLQNALAKIAEAKRSSSPESSSNDNTEEEAESEDTKQTEYSPMVLPETFHRLYPQYTGKNDVDKVESTKTTDSKVTDNVIKKTLNIDDVIPIGDNSYKITNLFGIREGANSVPGREGQHSRGVDVVGYNAKGKKTNVPIALTSGTITSISLQGSGRAYKPTVGAPSGGYIMDVTMPDGKVMKYMHLGKAVFDNKASLLGKRVNRGDILYEGDYSTGSGSQTGPHIKVMVTSVLNGKQVRDYSSPENDPSKYIIGGDPQ